MLSVRHSCFQNSPIFALFGLFPAKLLPVMLLTASSLAAHGQLAQPDPAVLGNIEVSQGNTTSEDLTDISLAHSSLVPAEPVSGGVEETEEYIREFYQMEWRSGDPVEVYVIRPKGPVKPPVVIYLYGYPVDANRFRNPEFCRLVTRGGVAAIGFVPAMIGQRYHGVPMKQWFVSELHDSIVKTVHDVQMIVSYAASRPDLDGSRVAVFGQGAGATIAGLAAKADPRIQAVDLLDPWGDWPEWMSKSNLIPEGERGGFLRPEYLTPLAPLDPVNWLPSLSGRALKLDDALYETNTPAAAKARIEAALPSSARLIQYSTKTDFEKHALDDGKIVAWIQEQVLSRFSPKTKPQNASAPPLARDAAATSRPDMQLAVRQP